VNYHHTFRRTGAYETPEDGNPYMYTDDPYPEVETSETLPVPFVAGTQRFGKLAIGEGLFGPQGNPKRGMPDRVDTESTDGIAPNPARYDILTQDALIALPSVAVAYRALPWLDVGVRASWGIGTIKASNYTWAILNTPEDEENDGRFVLDVKDLFIPAFGAGILARAGKNLEFGLAWTSMVNMKAKGRGEAYLGDKVSALPTPDGSPNEIVPLGDGIARACGEGGTGPTDLVACADVAVPMTATIGGRFILRDQKGEEVGDLELDVRWENWGGTRDVKNVGDVSNGDIAIIVDGQDKTGFQLNPAIIRHGWSDTFSIRLGGQYRIPVGANALIVRGGASMDTAAAPDEWTRLDLDGAGRHLVALGFAWEMSRYRIDLGGAWIHESDRTVTELPRPMAGAEGPCTEENTQPSPAQPLENICTQEYSPFNAGEHSSGYWIASVGVTAWW
jgi:hypothetical protein